MNTTKTAILLVLAATLGLTLASCQTICETFTGSTHIGPTPGGDCRIDVTPSETQSFPNYWATWDFDGKETAGTPVFHTVSLGSEKQDVDVGGAKADEDVSYMLVIEGLTSGSASALLKKNTSDPGATVTVTDVPSVEGTTETFSVFVRESVEKNGDLYLYVLKEGEGIRVVVKDWTES